MQVSTREVYRSPWMSVRGPGASPRWRCSTTPARPDAGYFTVTVRCRYTRWYRLSSATIVTVYLPALA